jgi:DNA-binding LacI/PurR family transcriptional regulator
MSTIKQVAELAGVSIGTVSHVITGSVQVSKRLRAKVQVAIRELDYYPNHVARSLKTSKTRTLGIIVPDLTIPFFPRVIRGAEAAALQRNYSLIAVNSDDNDAREKELLALLRSQRVEGILLVVAAGAAPIARASGIKDSGVALVYLDRIPEGLLADSVSVDNSAAADMGVSHLISMGYRSIAIVTGSLSLRNEQERLQGYRQALRRAGIKQPASLIWEGNFRPEDVTAICRERLCNSRARPTAVFSTNGPTGLGVLRALRDCQLKTPDDIGFVTFDELTVDDLFTPSVTAVVQPAYEIGFRAAEILIQRIEEGHVRGGTITARLPAKLEIRESSCLVESAHRGRGNNFARSRSF